MGLPSLLRKQESSLSVRLWITDVVRGLYAMLCLRRVGLNQAAMKLASKIDMDSLFCQDALVQFCF